MKLNAVTVVAMRFSSRCRALRLPVVLCSILLCSAWVGTTPLDAQSALLRAQEVVRDAASDGDACDCASSTEPAPDTAQGLDIVDIAAPSILLAPWELPPEELATQRLYRMDIESGERSGSLRLTLRLAEPDHFLLTAVDPLGRRLWTLQVEGERTLWLDHRRETLCRGDDAPPPFLGGLTLAGLPAVLLGRLPEPPGSDQEVERWSLDDGQHQLRYVDESGRQWSARLDVEGRVSTWSSRLDPDLVAALSLEEGDLDEDVVRWQRDRRGASLRDPARQLEARWRETLREPLPEGANLEPVIAGTYREVSCGFDRRDLQQRGLDSVLPDSGATPQRP